MNKLFEKVYRESKKLLDADDFEDWHDFANWMEKTGKSRFQNKEGVIAAGLDYDSIVNDLLPPFGDTYICYEDCIKENPDAEIGYDGSFYYPIDNSYMEDDDDEYGTGGGYQEEEEKDWDEDND